MTGEAFVEGVLAGERLQIARAINTVEAGAAGAAALLERLHAHTGRAWRIGITGPPGAGKSTLTARMVRALRGRGARVAVIAIDPSSPFSQGAVLGDRVRMTEVADDKGVYIRSMATRGELGGLSRKTIDAADVLDAAGFDFVIIETAGVGQSELEVAGAADSTVVVLVPESGDFVQAMKAGLMEIADFFVLNKSDRPNANDSYNALKAMLVARPAGLDPHWRPDVLRTVAAEDGGTAELMVKLDEHRAHLETGGRLERRRRAHAERRVRRLVDTLLAPELWDAAREQALAEGAAQVVAREQPPYRLAEALVAHFRRDIVAAKDDEDQPGRQAGP